MTSFKSDTIDELQHQFGIFSHNLSKKKWCLILGNIPANYSSEENLSHLDSNCGVYEVQVATCTNLFLMTGRWQAEKNLNLLYPVVLQEKLAKAKTKGKTDIIGVCKESQEF